jgi:hypothetical protein
MKQPPLRGLRGLLENSAKTDLQKKEKRFTPFGKISSLFGKMEWTRPVEKIRREVIESARETGLTSYDAGYLWPALHLKLELNARPFPSPQEGEGGAEGVI